MADLSKVNVKGTVYDLKDKTGRDNMDTLIGTGKTAGTAVLGAAAWEGVASAIDQDGLVSAAIAKAYTDQQVATIHNFDVVVPAKVAAEIPEGAIYKDAEGSVTGTLAASASTMFKLYLVKNSDAGAGAHIEYITVRSGAEGSYTYAWEQIGTTVVDLSNYVQKTTTVAGVALDHNITVAELEASGALNLKALAHKDKASATYTPAGTISQINATPAGTVTVTLKDAESATEATLTKADYTPSGSVNVTTAENGAVVTGVTHSIALKDSAQSATDITYEGYTPAGSVSLTASETGTFQVAGTNAASAVTFDKTDATVATALKDSDTKAAAFTEGAFTPAAIQEGFYTAGSDASLSAGAQASLTDQSKAKFAKKAFKFEASKITGSDDYELDITEVLNTDTDYFTDAVTDRGTFTANTLQTLTGGKAAVIDTTKFSGGSKAADTFSAEYLPEIDATKSAKAITGLTNVQAAAQTFTGSKFAPAFSGTVANIKATAVAYNKSIIDQDNTSFSVTKGNLGFAGTKVTDALVSKVEYVKPVVNTASFSGTENKVTPTFTGTEATIEVQ